MSARARPPESGGVRAIVWYKLAKAILQAVLTVIIAVLVGSGSFERAHQLAMALRDHLVHPWSIHLAELLLRSLTARHLWWVAGALGCDALISAFEAWALAEGYAWAAWFVVAATSLLLPFELWELWRKPTIGHAVILLVNLAIVIVLLRRQLNAPAEA
jgi:uncharacterized membrane protein (DUF2068 family)